MIVAERGKRLPGEKYAACGPAPDHADAREWQVFETRRHARTGGNGEEKLIILAAM